MTGGIFSTDSFFWSCIWQSTVLLVAGLLGSYLLRRHSARAHCVLFLAMITAVIVPAASIFVKHYKLGMFLAKTVVIQAPGEPHVMHETTRIISNNITESNPAPINRDLHPAMTGSDALKFPWHSVLLYAWVVASLILAIRLIVTFVLGARLLRLVIPLDCGKIKQAIDQAKTKLGISNDVKIYGSAKIHSPVIWCWKRTPIMLIPTAASQTDIDWTGVLCHELAHYKRRDHVVGLLTELTVCLLPWQPLLWLAKSRLISLSEQACDDWVVASGQSGTDYAESLLNLTPEGQMAFVPAVVTSKKGLAGRVHRILKDSCVNPRSGLLWSIMAVILALSIAMGIAFAQKRPAKPKATGQDIRETKATSVEPAQETAVNEDKVKLYLFDTNGKRVFGAKVGTDVRTKEAAFLGSKLSWLLRGKENNSSNERGEIELTRKNLFLDWWPPEYKAVLYVLHEERKIGAICEISKDDSRGEIHLTLEPVCHVHGKLSSEALKKIGRPLTSTNVYMYWNKDSFGILSHSSRNQQLEFLVPPGRYTLDAYGGGEGVRTEHVHPEIEVKTNQSDLDIGTIDLPPMKLALLIGKPAPELGLIKAWKNGSPVKLSELRGKLVILYFGGEYPSTNRDLPRLIELYQEFSEANLVIIGLYNCESMKQLEDRFSEFSKKYGGEPEVPFRLAIDGGKGRIVEGTDRQVPGETYAAYDIKVYTTTILIDQKGNLVEILNLRQAKEKLENLLNITIGSEQPVWKQQFEKMYRLEEGQILKRIAPPFIPERKEYFVNEKPSQAKRYPEGPAMMIFNWNGSQVNLSYTLDHHNFSLNNLVQYIFKISTPDMWWGDTKNYTGNPDGPEQLLSMKLPGDWIIRNEASPQAKARAIEKLIAEELGRHINIRNRIEQRDVIVATGQFKFSPVYGDEAIVMFADEDESVRKKGETVFNGTNSIATFLKQLEWLVSIPVIDRTEIAEDTIIEYQAYLGWPSLRRIKNISEKKEKLRFFLNTLSEQTSLQFEITRVPMDVWFVTESE